MAKSKLNLNAAEYARNKLTATQQKQIKSLYSNAVKTIHKQMQFLDGKENVSSILKRQYLNRLEKQLQNEISNISKELESQIKKNVKDVAQQTVKCNEEWLKSVGLNFKVNSDWSNIPTKIVQRIMTGNLYERKTPLSERIWGMEQKTLQDINKIISDGVTLNRSAYDIAKDLEEYVNPEVRKKWDWNKVYPNTNKKIDYSAQRLARTMISHAYQQSLIMTSRYNPFITGIQWRSAMIHGRTCQLCMERDGQVYKKNELPLDHPNGLCTFTAVIEKSNEDIINDISNWYKNPTGTFPELDKFADYISGTSWRDIKNIVGNVVKTFDKNESREYFSSQYNNREFLNYDEQRAILSYTKNGYTRMNSYLRGLEVDTGTYTLKETRQQVETITKALEKYPPLKDSIKVYRNVDLKAFEVQEENINSLVGCTFSDKAFLSTTTELDALKKSQNAIMEIVLPKGSTPGAYVADISDFKSEQEFIIKAGKEFEITNAKVVDGKYIFEMRYINE